MKSRAAVRIGVVAAACLAAAASAGAQTLQPADQHAVPGLFGQWPRGSQALDLTLSASGGYDQDLVALQDSTLPDTGTQNSGPYEGVDARIRYVKKFRHALLGFGEGSSLRYYPSVTDVTALQHSAVGAFSFERGRTSMLFSQTLLYSPFYSVAQLPAVADPGFAALPASSADQSVVRHQGIAYGSVASISQGIGRRLVFSFAGTYQNTEFQHESNSLRTESGAANLSYQVGRNVALVAGYGYQHGMYTYGLSSPSTADIRTINLGIDYSRALSMSRKTTLTFKTGTAAVEQSTGVTSYRLAGSAELSREIGRTWRATAIYSRGAGLIQGLSQPTFANSVSTGLVGTLSRHIDVTLLGAYSRDQLGATNEDGLGHTYSGTANMRMAMSRYTALSLDYVFYKYGFDRSALLPEGLPSQFNRQEIRVGFDASLPLIR